MSRECVSQRTAGSGHSFRSPTGGSASGLVLPAPPTGFWTAVFFRASSESVPASVQRYLQRWRDSHLDNLDLIPFVL